MCKAYKILSFNTKTKYIEQMLSSSIVCNAEQGGSSFGSVDEILKRDHSNENFLWYCLLYRTRWFDIWSLWMKS